MSEFILILAVYYSSTVSLTAALFPSQAACEAAKTIVQQEWERSRAICVPRGTGQ